MGDVDCTMNVRAALLIALVAVVLLSAECGKPKSAAQWREISKKSEEKMRDEEEAERKANMPEPVPFDAAKLNGNPEMIQQMMSGQKAGKPAMMFVTVVTKDRAATDKWAGVARSILKDANGVDCQSYVIEDDKVLFSCMDGSQGFKLKAIVLGMSEVAEFEWDNAKSPGPAKEEYDKIKSAKKAAEEQSKDKEEVGNV